MLCSYLQLILYKKNVIKGKCFKAKLYSNCNSNCKTFMWTSVQNPGKKLVSDMPLPLAWKLKFSYTKMHFWVCYKDSSNPFTLIQFINISHINNIRQTETLNLRWSIMSTPSMSTITTMSTSRPKRAVGVITLGKGVSPVAIRPLMLSN